MSVSKRWLSMALFIAFVGGAGLAQTTELISVAYSGQNLIGGFHPAISGDGRYVAFSSGAPNIVPGDTNGMSDVFVRDRVTGSTQRVSVGTSGAQQFRYSSGWPSISADGRYVAFQSAGPSFNGLPAALSQVFVNDSRTGESVMVSVDSSGVRGNGASARPSISADGRYVAFDSSATNLVPNDDNGKLDVFVHDRRTHTTIRASVSSPREESSYDSYWPSLSADGRSVAFVSASSLVPDGWFGVQDIYVHDCESGVTRRRSADSFGAGGDHHSEAPSISADGRFVAFSSQADNLVPQGTTFQGSWGVFVHDRSTGETSIVSVDSAGVQGNGQSDMPSISADGRFVMFSSTATNLVPGDTNGASDIFVHDRLTGATSRVSVDSSGAQGDSDSFTFTYGSCITADGRSVAFLSLATNLVPGDVNNQMDVFVHDSGEGRIVASCFGDGHSLACPCANDGLPGHGCDNSAGTGGAKLAASGHSSLSADSLLLSASDEMSTALSLFVESGELTSPAVFGSGLLCLGGEPARLYVEFAVGGVATAPQAGDASIAARSAALGEPIPWGATRHYQTYYRDPALSSCPAGTNAPWNVTNALSAIWSP